MNAENKAAAAKAAEVKGPREETEGAHEEMSPEGRIVQLAMGALLTQALYVAAKLGVADMLSDGPQKVSRLAERTQTNEEALYRTLRALASEGIFRETEPGVFDLTPSAATLRTDAPNSMRNCMIFMGEEYHWKAWAKMLHSVRTGETGWKEAHGAEVFDYFAEHAEEAEIFNRAMSDMSLSTAPAVVEGYDFSNIKTLADIGGGHGLLLAHVLKANPQMKGVLFDVPQVVEGADSLLEAEGVADRVEKVAGDFFKSVPKGADAYMMKFIIHDWDDERSRLILKNVHAALPQEGKVLLIETVVPEGNEPHHSKIIDLEMLVSPGGKERTEREYGELLKSAGFRLARVVTTKSPYSVIEGVKTA